MRLVTAAASGLASTLAGQVLVALTGILTARMLGPEAKGTFVFAFVVPGLAVAVLSLSLGPANVFLIARGRHEERTVLWTSLALVLPLGLACTLALQNSPILGLAGHAGPYLRLAAWSIVPTMGYGIIRHTVLGKQRYHLFNVFNVLDKGAALLFVAATGAILGPDTMAFCAAFVAASIVSFAAALVIIWRATGDGIRVDVVCARESLHYGLRGHVGWMADLLNYRLDMLFVHALAGARPLGLYSAAVSIAEGLWLVPNGLAMAMKPRLMSTAPSSSVPTAAVARATFCASLAAAVALALTGRFVITLLFGAEFAGAYRPLCLLLFGVAAMSIVKILNADMEARDRPGLVSVTAWVTLSATVLLDLALIPEHGAAGAAAASTVAYTLAVGLTVTLYLRLSSTTLRDLFVPRGGDFGMIARNLRLLFRRNA